MSTSKTIVVFGVRYGLVSEGKRRTVWVSNSGWNYYIEKNRRGFFAFSYLQGRKTPLVSKSHATPENAVTDLTLALVARERKEFDSNIASLMKMTGARPQSEGGDS